MASFAQIIAKVMPSVVTIRIIGKRYQPVELKPGEPPKPQAKPFTTGGTGVIIDAVKGLIGTNHHVIDGAVAISVGLYDGRMADAELIGSDPATDIAVLKIDLPDLTALPFGDSDTAQVGDFVVAIGNPYGLEGTATAGIISGLMRTDVGHDMFESFIQTDAAVNPGNSGGPLVNLKGELIAVNTAIAGGKSNIGIGFAIPINMARRVGKQIVIHKRMKRGIVGLETRDLRQTDARELGLGKVRGALVTGVVPGSPAAEAGIGPKTVIIGVNGAPIKSNGHYVAWTGTSTIGDTLQVEITDGTSARIVPLTVRDMPLPGEAVPVPAETPLLGGLTAAAIDPGSPHYGQVQGLVLQAVAAQSPAELAGFKTGDILTAVNGEPIPDAHTLAQLAKAGTAIEQVAIEREGIPYLARAAQ
jgi:S1-C subfamily serine protease